MSVEVAAAAYLLFAALLSIPLVNGERQHPAPRYDMALVAAALWPLTGCWAVVQRLFRWMED